MLLLYINMYFFSSLEKMLKSEYFSGDELVTIATFMKLTTCDSCKVGWVNTTVVGTAALWGRAGLGL